MSKRYAAHSKGACTTPNVLIYSSQSDTDSPACPLHCLVGAIHKGRDGNEWKKPSRHLCFDPSPISVTQLLAFGILISSLGTNCITVMWALHATEEKMISENDELIQSDQVHM